MVEQGTENPRVGGSTPSLATSSASSHKLALARILAVVFCCGSAVACQPDACERLCAEVAGRLDECLDQWPVGWEEFDVQGARAFQTGCEQQWAQVRSDLEPREFDDAGDQCSEGIDALQRMRVDASSCSELRAMYLDP